LGLAMAAIPRGREGDGGLNVTDIEMRMDGLIRMMSKKISSTSSECCHHAN